MAYKAMDDVLQNIQDTVHNGEDTIFDRIHIHHDITHIKLIYRDEAAEEFTVAWEADGDDAYSNCLQHTSINMGGNLVVKIQKD